MGCDWELFELRLHVYTAGKWSGAKFTGSGLAFWKIAVDTNSLGNFEGSNDFCDFKPIFKKLADSKVITFAFSPNRYGLNGSMDPMSYFDVLERAKSISYAPQVFPGAMLYVHRQDRSDAMSQHIGPSVLYENVQVISTLVVKDTPEVTLFAGSGRIWGF